MHYTGKNISSTIIRLYLLWCAVSTSDGNGDLMFDKWQSLLNHLVSQHTDHSNSLFSSSLHSIEYNTDNKDWFEPEYIDLFFFYINALQEQTIMKVFAKSYNIKLEKDIKKVSPIYQTAALESFHSLVIKFAPKHTAFSYLGMQSRLHIAAMHYNENCGEETDDTDEEGNV
ncbi:uncharacterized protein LOC106063943 [Biomphalaria glabrata]|uniref:Uncharacterized protein LOC106063943 n=1 Tax=Biomphalaria glabrata TaxID=6526 RepID=A0A9W3AXF0_BIOGL|nr:uncharacterized protein LOC106063943 [Biomphalaria glabrata]